MPAARHILMIRPVNFHFNRQTAVNNAFQVAGEEHDVQQNALREFDGLVEALRSRQIEVTVIDDTPEPHTPDSLFPNNWISFHEDGSMVIYPMFAENRRLERKPRLVEDLRKRFGVKKMIDFSRYEEQGKYLEGTGSVVLDRDIGIAYACLSPRTDKALFAEFCKKMHFRPVVFSAFDAEGRPIYHTNVMMCVADSYVVICTACIAPEDLPAVMEAITGSGKEIIAITPEQMNRFAGNMLQVQNNSGKKFLVMSSAAHASLSPEQLGRLESYNAIIYVPLTTIEKNGGGSARCMMAEVYPGAERVR